MATAPYPAGNIGDPAAGPGAQLIDSLGRLVAYLLES